MAQIGKPRIPAGDSFKMEFNLVDENNVPVPMLGTTIRWTLTVDENDFVALLEKTIGNGVSFDVAKPGEIIVNLMPADTALLPPRDYWQQIRITFPNGTVKTPHRGWLTVLPTVPL